jgi:hypothetical protein
VAERHVLGGRGFLTVQESSVEQDFIFLSLIKDAGIDEVLREPEEAPEDFARRLLETTVKSGTALRLLGCLLVPEKAIPKRRFGRRAEPGEIWTPDMSEETAQFIGQLRDRKDKAKINSLVLSLLISFFSAGIVSLWTSTMSSRETVPEENETPAPDDTVHGPTSS